MNDDDDDDGGDAYRVLQFLALPLN